MWCAPWVTGRTGQKTSPSSLYDHYTYTFFISPEWDISIQGLVRRPRFTFAYYVYYYYYYHCRCSRISFWLRLTSIRYTSFLSRNQSENQIAISNLCLPACACVCVQPFSTYTFARWHCGWWLVLWVHSNKPHTRITTTFSFGFTHQTPANILIQCDYSSNYISTTSSTSRGLTDY